MTWLNDATVTTADDKAAAQNEQARQSAKAERDSALQALTFDLGNGHSIQCREQDELRLRRTLERMNREGLAEHPWISTTNEPILLTQAEIQAALTYGEDQVAEIFAQYMSAAL